jgi:hypothetical protein
MNSNKELINNFYASFQQLDFQGMASCYDENIVFFDPVFGLLSSTEVNSMWEMICTTAVDFSLTYGNILELDDAYCTCDWVSSATFPGTNRRVVNKVRANMRFSEGKIIEHSDAFSVHQWSKQAMGLSGELLGWNSFFQRGIKNRAKKNLIKFLQAKG